MTYTLSAFVNIDLASFLVIIGLFITIVFFIAKKAFSKKLSHQKKSLINIYAGIFSLLFTVVVIIVVLYCLI